LSKIEKLNNIYEKYLQTHSCKVLSYRWVNFLCGCDLYFISIWICLVNSPLKI